MSSNGLQRDLAASLRGTQASGIVVDIRTGSTLAQDGGLRRAVPGSTLKPLLLEFALEHGIVRADTTVLCRRNLRIGNRPLACTHPADTTVFTAESALAESCNTYFADLGGRYSATELEHALRLSGLQHRRLVGATDDERALTVLGLNGVSATPLELARAYRRLALSMPIDGAVARGLADAVEYGMADPARVSGLRVLGKTGTASDPGQAWTHGWFAAILPGRLVLVILLPHGDGGAAARLGRDFFLRLEADRSFP